MDTEFHLLTFIRRHIFLLMFAFISIHFFVNMSIIYRYQKTIYYLWPDFAEYLIIVTIKAFNPSMFLMIIIHEFILIIENKFNIHLGFYYSYAIISTTWFIYCFIRFGNFICKVAGKMCYTWLKRHEIHIHWTELIIFEICIIIIWLKLWQFLH